MQNAPTVTDDYVSPRIVIFLDRHKIIRTYYKSLLDIGKMTSQEHDILMLSITGIVDEYTTIPDDLFYEYVSHAMHNKEFARHSLLRLCLHESNGAYPQAEHFIHACNNFFHSCLTIDIPRERIGNILAPYWFVFCMSLWDGNVST